MGTFNMPTGNVLLLVVLLTAGFAAVDRQRREMQAALAAERLKTAYMTDELKAAHDIQLGMVPRPGTIEGLPDTLDFHALLEPAEAVGGDLYDAFMLDAQRLCFLIGDVTGKGVPAALFMALSKTLYKSAALRAHLALHELMRAVNSEIARENPAQLFVTLLAGLLDTRTGALELCRAGHAAPLLLRRGEAPSGGVKSPCHRSLSATSACTAPVSGTSTSPPARTNGSSLPSTSTRVSASACTCPRVVTWMSGPCRCTVPMRTRRTPSTVVRMKVHVVR
jgi:hypothetical protein